MLLSIRKRKYTYCVHLSLQYMNRLISSIHHFSDLHVLILLPRIPSLSIVVTTGQTFQIQRATYRYFVPKDIIFINKSPTFANTQ